LVLAFELVTHDVAEKRRQVQTVEGTRSILVGRVSVPAVDVCVGRVTHVIIPQAYRRVGRRRATHVNLKPAVKRHDLVGGCEK
jgi:hypothetical protein